MKIKKPLLFLLLIVTFGAISQPRFRQKLEQIKALKVAYLTDELALTPDEASKFWPIYNAYDDKQKELRQLKIRSYLDRIDPDEIDKISEKDAANLLNQIESAEDELYQLRKKFNSNLKGILPIKKILKLKKAEEGFNRKLLRQYRDKAQRN